MDKQFDELSKSLAEGVSRREALRKFGIGLAGVLLAAVGLKTKAAADNRVHCWSCVSPYVSGLICTTGDPGKWWCDGMHHHVCQCSQTACSSCASAGIVCTGCAG